VRALRRLSLLGALLVLAVLPAVATAEQRVTELVSTDPPNPPPGFAVCSTNSYHPCGTRLTPDGRAVVFLARSSEFPYGPRIYRHSPAGTEPVGIGARGEADFSCLPEANTCSFNMTPDAKRIFFETHTSILDAPREACGYCRDIFEWRDGSLTLLSPDAANGLHASLTGVSADGQHVFFDLDEEQSGNLIPRAGFERSGGQTRRFPNETTPAEDAFVAQQGASPDGARVFFASRTSLVPEDTDSCQLAWDLQAGGCSDIYLRGADGSVTLLSTGPAAHNESVPAQFVAATPDGRHAFFTTAERLFPEDTQGGTYEWSFDGGLDLIPGTFDAVSDDGRTVLFTSGDALTADDTDRAADVYELRDGRLRLLSGAVTENRNLAFLAASPDLRTVAVSTGRGFAFYGRSDDGTVYEVSVGSAKALFSYRGQIAAISKDLRRIFFETDQSLLPADGFCDVAQSLYCNDVYEYSEGSITLISTGPTDRQNGCGEFYDCPRLVGISGDGRRAFFATAGAMTADDPDNANDIYVSRLVPRACRPDKPAHTPKKCAR
jgi:hypothetical protein